MGFIIGHDATHISGAAGTGRSSTRRPSGARGRRTRSSARRRSRSHTCTPAVVDGERRVLLLLCVRAGHGCAPSQTTVAPVVCCVVVQCGAWRVWDTVSRGSTTARAEAFTPCSNSAKSSCARCPPMYQSCLNKLLRHVAVKRRGRGGGDVWGKRKKAHEMVFVSKKQGHREQKENEFAQM